MGVLSGERGVSIHEQISFAHEEIGGSNTVKSAGEIRTMKMYGL